jgi:hypothetical protein
MNNLINGSPYLRETRSFPGEDELVVELNKAYIDTSLAVNARTIGLFPTNRGAITGEKWYLSQNRPQQSVRRVYPFTSTASINHTLTLSELSQFSRLFGTYTDGTNWYGLIAGSNVAIAGQQGFYITPTQIVFVSGGGAPTVTQGTIVLEWLSFP